ncbi:hypothetical protein ACILD6_09015 [Capnocytophaga canimorsus]|uniref:hypothetical protein n=1 Tax=Capnocytophaga canimorsus TaxID=28188 RepID=UPI0037CE8D3D
MSEGAKSFIVFFKVLWYLSIFAFCVYLSFDANRIYDVITYNYKIENMIMEKESYSFSAKGDKVLTIYGHINGKRVLLNMFDEEINFNLFEKDKNISVIKFRHSKRVLLADNYSFISWRKKSFRYIWYVLISIVIIIFKRKYKISITNILTKYYGQ